MKTLLWCPPLTQPNVNKQVMELGTNTANKQRQGLAIDQDGGNGAGKNC